MTQIFRTIALCFFLMPLYACLGGSSKSPDNEMSHQCISFTYPSYWESSIDSIGENHFYIQCEERFSNGTFLLVTCTKGKNDLLKMILNFLKETDDASDNITVSSQSGGSATYGKYDCLMFEYTLSAPLNVKSYGKVYAFNTNGKSILIIEQSERHYNLKHDKFKRIRDSFTISGATSPEASDNS